MSRGPSSEVPVALSKTWKPVFTIWTYWVSPISPFVSGGTQKHDTPGATIPSKLSVVAGMFGPKVLVWRAPSGV